MLQALGRYETGSISAAPTAFTEYSNWFYGKKGTNEDPAIPSSIWGSWILILLTTCMRPFLCSKVEHKNIKPSGWNKTKYQKSQKQCNNHSKEGKAAAANVNRKMCVLHPIWKAGRDETCRYQEEGHATAPGQWKSRPPFYYNHSYLHKHLIFTGIWPYTWRFHFADMSNSH